MIVGRVSTGGVTNVANYPSALQPAEAGFAVAQQPLGAASAASRLSASPSYTGG